MILKTNNFRAPEGKSRIRGRIIIFGLITALIFSFFHIVQVNAEGQFLSRRNLLRTSYNLDNFSLFQLDGDTIYARGKYTGDRIKRITVSIDDEITGYKMSIGDDGSYEAEITCPTTYEIKDLIVELSSGMKMKYVMYYDNGWYFPDTGLTESNRKVFDNITDAPPKSVGYYMSAAADAHEIAVVQEQIKLISDSVIEGIEGDYEKAKALCSYVAEHFYYDHDAKVHSVSEANVVLLEVLKTTRTVCTGFADLYCALLQAQGIDAVNIIGGSTGGGVTPHNLADGLQNHEFTAFFYEEENRWVWVDSCWCGSGDYKNGEFIDRDLHLKYFDISDEALAYDHRADYAQRRDFFNAEASETPVTSQTTSETTSVTAPPQTTASEGKITSEIIEGIFEEEEKKPAPNDTGLYIIAAVLAVAVIGTLAAVIKITRKKP